MLLHGQVGEDTLLINTRGRLPKSAWISRNSEFVIKSATTLDLNEPLSSNITA